MTDYVISPFQPPGALVYLEEEMVSNGVLPYIHVGTLLVQGLWHLLGQHRAEPVQWLGMTDDPYLLQEGTPLTFRLHTKLGTRDAIVDLHLFGEANVEDFEITVSIELDGAVTSRSRAINMDSTGSPLIEYASWLRFNFDTGLGPNPGQIQNMDTDAEITISTHSKSYDIWLWSVGVQFLHTTTLEQE